ncbi:large ribosomal subunit protein mL52 [Epargyreus clarus]|uniref:large ribosomal subunit protein mL52 n=1 Tax=Epargyreus clarus TaxID=520877 RepID=UPI003C2C84AE
MYKSLNGLCYFQSKLVFRFLSRSSVLSIKQWREERGLPVNKNAEGVLTDTPDYTFLDGRPTPLLHKQKLRMVQNENNAKRIVELCSELKFAKQRHQDILRAEREEREQIQRNWLKPKGAQNKKN